MTFWILAPIMVAAALGILFVRKAVHAALLLAVVMISLAFLYAVLDADPVETADVNPTGMPGTPSTDAARKGEA